MPSRYVKFGFLWCALIAAGSIVNAQQPPCSKQAPQKFVSSCNPFGNNATHTAADNECPIGGDSKPGTAENEQDLVKNNFCAKAPPTNINIVQLAKLQQITVKTLKISEGSPPANRGPLSSSTELPFHEGDLVRLKAFVLKAETADIANDEGGESVNCNIGPKNGCSNSDSVPRNDIHIALVASPNQTECDSVTAEITPHLRPAAWSAAEIQGLKDKLVRISGQLMFDGSHSVCTNGKAKFGSPSRQSSWEIHPVYSIEVCQKIVKNGCAETDWKALQ